MNLWRGRWQSNPRIGGRITAVSAVTLLCAVLLGGTIQVRAAVAPARSQLGLQQSVASATVTVPNAPALVGPGSGFYAIAVLGFNQVFPITGVSADGQFWQINTRYGLAFVAASQVSASNTVGLPVITTGPIATVTQGIGILRAASTVGSRRVAIVYKGAEFFIVGKNADGSWLQVQYLHDPVWLITSATDQFVAATNNGSTVTENEQTETDTQTTLPTVTAGPRAIVGTGALKVHSGPSLEFTTIGTLPAGSTVQILGRSEDSTWLLVETSFGNGWIKIGYVATLDYDPTTSPVIPNEGLPVGVTTGRVFTGTIILRNGPNTAFANIGDLGAGTQITIKGQSSDGQWWFVDSPIGSGWVSKLYILVTGSIANIPVVTP